MKPMQTATGLDAFQRSLALPHSQMMVVEGARSRIAAHLQEAQHRKRSSAEEKSDTRQQQTGQAGEAISQDQLQQDLKDILSTVLHIKSSVIDMDQPFAELGLDSLLGVKMTLEINKKYGTALTNISFYDYPTVSEFSRLLEQELKKLPAKPPGRRRSIRPIPSRHVTGRLTAGMPEQANNRIAIIGMSGRYAKANNLREYWRNLAQGRNCIVEVPRWRWDVERYYDPDPAKKGKTVSKWLGAADDIDCFDPLFFRISPQDAEHMDPQHRLFLQESYNAFEDAGYSGTSLSNRKCGVYLGISTSEYELRFKESGGQAATVTSNSHAIAAARIAYYLNLKGPAIAVDTACSSSLVAIHLACQGLLSGEVEMALAGGVTLWLAPESYLSMSQAGMFSPVGQCKTFDDTADGIVNGEGVGAVVLKRLADAESDHDFIYGVILGSGINQDGKTNGITAPSINSQIELERAVYARNGINPKTISYVETHGTGTKLGDPIELQALATVFAEKTSKKNFCGLGSVKSNIGHTTAAAGVAGVQKVLLSMQHRTLAPSLNVTKENSRFDFQNSPFYICRTTRAWETPANTPRRAAVSSFGFSGTNAHLVIEEYSMPERAVTSSSDATLIVPISARTEEQLRQRARDLLEFFKERSQCGSSVTPVELASIAYTLQVGREAMEERLVMIVDSVDQLAERLSAYLEGERNLANVYQGHVDSGNRRVNLIAGDDDVEEAIDKCMGREKVPKLLAAWVSGLNLDWNRVYGDEKPHLVSLPGYPFAKEHYWIDNPTVCQSNVSRRELEIDMQSIDSILGQIEDNNMEAEQAVQELKALI
jgi:acyl transferase domain-containing protein/acyl carrier protein